MRVEVSHIQFTDDTLLFVNNKSHLRFLVEILNSFCQMSGLMINMEKEGEIMSSSDRLLEGKLVLFHTWGFHWAKIR